MISDCEYTIEFDFSNKALIYNFCLIGDGFFKKLNDIEKEKIYYKEKKNEFIVSYIKEINMLINIIDKKIEKLEVIICNHMNDKTFTLYFSKEDLIHNLFNKDNLLKYLGNALYKEDLNKYYNIKEILEWNCYNPNNPGNGGFNGDYFIPLRFKIYYIYS